VRLEKEDAMKRDSFNTVVFLLSMGVVHSSSTSAQTAQTSAKGSGQTLAISCATDVDNNPTVCEGGGQGLSFSFSFTGALPTVPNQAVPVTGKLSGVDRNTDTRYEFVSGVVFVVPSLHSMRGEGTCLVTTSLGQFLGSCEFTALDSAEPSSADEFCLDVIAPGFIGGGGCQVVSGNIQIQ
jgi:hypothetical protein